MYRFSALKELLYGKFWTIKRVCWLEKFSRLSLTKFLVWEHQCQALLWYQIGCVRPSVPYENSRPSSAHGPSGVSREKVLLESSKMNSNKTLLAAFDCDHDQREWTWRRTSSHWDSLWFVGNKFGLYLIQSLTIISLFIGIEISMINNVGKRRRLDLAAWFYHFNNFCDLIRVAWWELKGLTVFFRGGRVYWRKLLQNYLRRMSLVCIFRQLAETTNCHEKNKKKVKRFVKIWRLFYVNNN